MEVAARFKTDKQVHLCYLDFSKAFDLVVRNQLLEKLKHNGLSTNFHDVLSINLNFILNLYIRQFV